MVAFPDVESAPTDVKPVTPRVPPTVRWPVSVSPAVVTFVVETELNDPVPEQLIVGAETVPNDPVPEHLTVEADTVGNDPVPLHVRLCRLVVPCAVRFCVVVFPIPSTRNGKDVPLKRAKPAEVLLDRNPFVLVKLSE